MIFGIFLKDPFYNYNYADRKTLLYVILTFRDLCEPCFICIRMADLLLMAAAWSEAGSEVDLAVDDCGGRPVGGHVPPAYCSSATHASLLLPYLV
jgi:hypothetical protein